MWTRAFIDFLRYERGYSEHTIVGYEAALEAFRQYLDSLPEKRDWASLDGDVIRNWILDRLESGNSVSTVKLKLSAIKSFYKFLLQRKLISKDPAHSIVAPKGKKPLPCYVKDKEMDDLLDNEEIYPDGYVGERDRMILLMFYSTGIRASELIGLDIADVDLDMMQLRVVGKRNKERVIPYGDEVGDAIRSYLSSRRYFCSANGAESEALFLNEKTKERISYDKVRLLVNHYLSLVTSQAKKSPHVLRHTFATSMLNHRADLQSVKELLGHEKLSTTEIYTHASFEELKEMYNMAHPRAK